MTDSEAVAAAAALISRGAGPRGHVIGAISLDGLTAAQTHETTLSRDKTIEAPFERQKARLTCSSDARARPEFD